MRSLLCLHEEILSNADIFRVGLEGVTLLLSTRALRVCMVEIKSDVHVAQPQVRQT
jgi:hypothetical protein